ncbi:MAG: NAD(P)-dependent oxidoreductase [Chromatiaceae bacterium]|jgi:3-hydroxyisobutyrate dehydrogenase-like beta-hydroxyacid dehydrogenase|nr:NAD(P)-dependent oxidoreductase [Chromatiaceae bacterium]
MAHEDTGTLHGVRVGFAGLGLMGRPMCLNLLAAGADLKVWNRTRSTAEAFVRPGMQICDSPAALARASDIVVLMLADTTVVEQILFGPDGLEQGLHAGTLLIDMGTTAVMPTREFARRLAPRGVDYVDAPVSGGEIGAIDASLTVMAGGSEAALARAWPLLAALGSRITHVGEVGAGQVAKAANQIIVGLNIGAVAEALALVQAAGVDPGKVREALLGGFAGSRILEVHGQRMIEQRFQPGARVVTQYKDMRQAAELGALLGQPLPATELSKSLFAELIERGDGNLDHSALIRVLQKPAN